MRRRFCSDVQTQSECSSNLNKIYLLPGEDQKKGLCCKLVLSSPGFSGFCPQIQVRTNKKKGLRFKLVRTSAGILDFLE